MIFFDRIRIFFDSLEPVHKGPTAVCVVVLLLVIVVPSATQSRLSGHPPGSVTLAWDPSPSSCLAKLGYNLYRRENSGSYPAEPVNKELIKGPTYTDTSVLAGKTYYYVVKTKCGDTESGPSNEMKVDVPYKGKKGKK
ncbi:MAG TPA: fibronectin type III domain-containing protein [Pseudolabrys sp.]|nr:fibronectin type III domain-containing protein [Pseudolabrys sp.]